MVLNYIWIAFFLIAFVVAIGKLVIGGDTAVFTEIINASFASAKTGFEISLGLTGILSLWLGIMKIGEKGGVIQAFARLAAPVFSKLFPDIPRDHPVTGSIFMNLSANLLGLDNAATPMGLKAMQQLQELNPNKESASNSMVMFLCINASGLTLIPITIMMYRAQLGAANPSDVFLPIMLATFTSTLVAILAVCVRQKINILQRNLILFFGGLGLFIGGLVWLFNSMEQEQVSLYSTLFANTLLFTIICGFIISGMRKKINVYDAFIEGAKEGFQTAITIIPYLVAILVGIGVFRASGAMDFIIQGVRFGIASIGLNTDFVEALPTMLMKPLSGSGARGMMLDAMNTYGADSFVGRLSSIVQGSCDTTFYVVALYYGSVGIRNTRYTVQCALLADLSGAIAAIAMAYLFF
ncbi:nucleoside recognition domain-containing protein [Parabacteroides distasonis]|uniref:nucleoside recognition domain-containing protein n=1 Tax=Parabacteroides distasonis TaxID=823 RepID=UPI0018A9C7F3|nr:spore maturation protein [Parabacteroides distasonis]MDB9027095.1 nucleoside recognition domain-containing protein [Parabacteroides distasonis]MDB9043838.1 nucleoside recognition domain-containing protein [Parabacteroides distasonis]MDB9091090.1 nucleoside recognition domain-containing protein [Parabacteroides distasonis]MDB9161993.1 nucleoside recognition domain-containing protein [Parabacteroides distasonis]